MTSRKRNRMTRRIGRMVLPALVATMFASSAHAYPVVDEAMGPVRTSESTPSVPYSPPRTSSANASPDWPLIGAGTALVLTLGLAGTGLVLQTRNRLAAA